MEDEWTTSVFRFNFATAASEQRQPNIDKQNALLGYHEDGKRPAPAPQEVFPSEANILKDDVPLHQGAKDIRVASTNDEAVEPFTTDTVSFQGGFKLLKGRVSAASISGVDKSDLVPGKYEGGLKLWECTIDLVNTMRREIKDAQLSFRGKRVLELGCGHGLPGIFALLKGATTVHFQDFNVEVLKRLTIRNVAKNLERARAIKSLDSGISFKLVQLEPRVQYYAGDWGNVYELLSVVGSEDIQNSSHEEDATQVATSRLRQDSGDISERQSPGPQRRKQSESSRAFEQAIFDGPDGGYDIILTSETVYSSRSLPKLYNVIKKCLRPPYGVLYVAAKKHYFGVGGGARQFKALVDEDGILGAHLITSFVDGSSNIREIWKFFFK